MQLAVAKALKLPGEAFHFTLSERLPDEDFSGRRIAFREPVCLDGAYIFDGKAFTVTGEIKAQLNSNCARCEESFVEPLCIPFENRFVKGTALYEESYPYEGETLALLPMVLDEIFLHLPIASVCREDCRGLCPNCGCNLNTAQCDCSTDGVGGD